MVLNHQCVLIMVTQDGIRESIFFILIMFLLASCNENKKIDNMLGNGTSKKIALKEKYSKSDFFHSEFIRIYNIKDTSLYSIINCKFDSYDKDYICNYCSPNSSIYRYIKQGGGFFRINEVSSCRFIVTYIDTMNQQLLYHDISYTIN